MTEKAITELMEDEETTNTNKLSSIDNLAAETGKTGSNHRRHNQRRLVSEIESSVEEDGNARDDDDDDDDDDDEEDEKICSNKEIIKELKNIQRQNTITHCLLTASILATLAWQLSEFSLILRIKKGFNNPLESVGGAIKGLFTTGIQNNDQKQTQLIPPPTYLPGLNIPDWPGFDASNEEEEEDDDD